MILTGEDEVAMLKKILLIITRESNHNPVSRPRVLLIFPADRQEIPLVARTAVSRPWLSTWQAVLCILRVQWLPPRDALVAGVADHLGRSIVYRTLVIWFGVQDGHQ